MEKDIFNISKNELSYGRYNDNTYDYCNCFFHIYSSFSRACLKNRVCQVFYVSSFFF